MYHSYDFTTIRMIFLSFRPGPPSSLWRKIELSQRELKVFLGKMTIFSVPMKESLFFFPVAGQPFFLVFFRISAFPSWPSAIILIGVQVITEYWEDLLSRGGGRSAGKAKGERVVIMGEKMRKEQITKKKEKMASIA